MGRRFAAEGIAVAVVNYRLSPKIGYPAYVDDTAASFAWVYKNIKAHGGDPDSVFISGHSAGGYLAAMAALDPRYLKEYRLGLDAVAGAIPVSGQMITHATVRKERRIPAHQADHRRSGTGLSRSKGCASLSQHQWQQ